MADNIENYDFEHCPFCGEDTPTMDGNWNMAEPGKLEILTVCHKCNRRWWEIYELKGAREESC